MKNRLSSLLLATLIASPCALAQLVTTPQASPAAKTIQTIGITEVSVSYSRPAAKEREIWGALVPYGLHDLQWAGATHAPWRAGANENTVISFQHDAKVQGQPIKAGSYGFHLIIEESGEATAIFSSNYQSWGSYFYDPAEDVLRVSAQLEDAPFEERLKYEFSDLSKTGATLALHWENKRIPLSIEVDTDAIVVQNLKNEMRNDTGFLYQNVMAAANYLYENDLDLELALEWVDVSISRPYVGRRVKENLELKANILDKLERADEAKAVRAEIEAL